jgi:hypothetical protein
MARDQKGWVGLIRGVGSNGRSAPARPYTADRAARTPRPRHRGDAP